MFEPIDQFTPPPEPDFIKDFPPARFFSKNNSFIWWWWMFFFKEKGVRKQIITFWTAKTYPDVKVNGVNWGPAANLDGSPEKFSYHGMSTGWMWDGKEFMEMKPKVRRFENEHGEDSIKTRSHDITLKADRNSFFYRFCREDDDFDLCINSVSHNPPPVGYKRTLVTKKRGFDALKIYHTDWKGTLKTDGTSRKVSGSLYMQNITLNMPAIPWLWGVYHRDDGSYLTYFSNFVNFLMFRRKAEPEPGLDKKFKFLNKNLNYTPAGQPTKRFKHVRYKVTRQPNGLPQFEARAELGKERLRVKLRTLAKCTYAFERKKIWKNKFFYNEFPSRVVELEYLDKEGNKHVEDGKAWTGNSEYSWGILLN